MQAHLLSLLILLPIVGALGVLLLPAQSQHHKTIPLVVSFFQALVFIAIVTYFTSANAGLQLMERLSWFTIDLGSWGLLRAEYFIALDGLSLPLVGLSVFIFIIAILSSWKVEKSTKGYFVLLLILNAAVMGSFCAQDFLLFYLFFEFMLLPMFFLIGIWGGPKREYASIKFFLYTLLGSILILIVLIALVLSTKSPEANELLIHSFSMVDMQHPDTIISMSILDPSRAVHVLGVSARVWAFILLLIGFGIKLPMVPFHTWLPDAHVEAPTAISVLLAALLLKIGGYGLLRIVYPMFPDAAIQLSWFVALLGVIAILYGGLTAMASKDLKRLIAYSSVSHMGFVLLGMASVTPEGTSGAVYQMVSHGIISAMLFVLVGVLYDRTHDRMIGNYSGLAAKMPLYFSFTLIAFFASLGLPGFSGFMAEIMVFLGAFKSNDTNGLIHESFALIGTLGLALGAAYYLWTLQRMFFGKFHVKGIIQEKQLVDLTLQEKVILLPLALATLFFGLFPQVLLTVVNPFAESFSVAVLQTGKVLQDLIRP